MGTSLDNLKDEFRVQLPGVADAVINLELFNTIDELAREALRGTPPSDVDANPSTWLSSNNYTLHYQTLLHGTLAKLYAQVAKPYTSTDLAKAHFELYREYLKLSAAEAANADVSTRPIRLISAIQVQAPGARDAAIELELFNTADELAREALRITPPVTTDPVASWLPSLPVDQWTANYQCLFAGTLGRLLAQVDKPWASAELAKYHFDRYLRYLDQARGEGAAVAATDTIQVRLINALRVQLPAARDAEIKLEVFNTVDEVAREALRIAAPLPSAAFESWLTTDQWTANYQTVYEGTLFRMFGKVDKPWANADLAKFHVDRYRMYLDLSRGEAADVTISDTITVRLINAVRVQVPTVRDADIHLAMFNTVDELAREALRITPPALSNPLTSWLTTQQYTDNYQVIYEGTLFRLLSEQGKVWSSPDLAKLHFDRYQLYLTLCRDEAAAPAVTDTIQVRLVNALRVQLPGARDADIKLELFNTVDELARDALRIAAPGPTTAYDTWLTTQQWTDNYPTVYEGTLFRMLSQAGKPWASADLAKAHFDRYQAFLALSRGDAAAMAVADTVQVRLVNALRVQLPAARDSEIKLEVFNTVDELAREALRIAAPLPTTAFDALLTTNQWTTNYQAIYEGALYRMLSQTDKPWASADLAKVHNDRYQAYLALSRFEAAGTPLTIYDRIISNLRTEIPQARDVTLQLEVFSTIDKIRREALRLAPLTDTDTNPATWLTSAQYTSAYQAILHGTLYCLLAQQPGSNPELVKQHFTQFRIEMELLRASDASTQTTSDLTRLLNNARVNLPGANDDSIKLELFNTMNEFLKTTEYWKEDINFNTVASEDVYYIDCSNPATINRLVSVVNADGRSVAATMDEVGTILLGFTPSTVETLTAKVALTCVDPIDSNGYPQMPDWILKQHYDVLLAGLIGRMMLQKAKPWTDEQLAIFNMRKFRNGMAAARGTKNRMNLYGAQNWGFPTFARGSGGR